MREFGRLARFIDHWHARPVTARHGSSEAELRAVEDRLGFAIPAALRDFYGLIGRRIAPHGQDRLLRPEQLPDALVRDGSGRPQLLVFLVENQGVWACGVRPSCRGAGRAMLHFLWDDATLRSRPTLAAFLTNLVARETVMGGMLGPLVRAAHRGCLDWMDRYPRWSGHLPGLVPEDLLIPLPPGLCEEDRLRIAVRASEDAVVVHDRWVLARTAAAWDDLVSRAAARGAALRPLAP